MNPASRPRTNPCRGDARKSDTSSGTSAMKAIAGWPYFGNERASSTPETAAATRFTLSDDPGLELLFLLQSRRNRIRFVAVLELADAHPEHRWRALSRRDHVSRIALAGEPLDDHVRFFALTKRGHLDGKTGAGRFGGCRRSGSGRGLRCGRGWRGRGAVRPRRWWCRRRGRRAAGLELLLGGLRRSQTLCVTEFFSRCGRRRR